MVGVYIWEGEWLGHIYGRCIFDLLRNCPLVLPWWENGKETTYQSRGCGSISGPGRPHTPGQLGLCTTATEACTSQGLSPNSWASAAPLLTPRRPEPAAGNPRARVLQRCSPGSATRDATASCARQLQSGPAPRSWRGEPSCGGEDPAQPKVNGHTQRCGRVHLRQRFKKFVFKKGASRWNVS